MSFWDLFKPKKASEEVTPAKSRPPKEILQDVAEFIPDHYKQDRQFINFLEFMENNEWGLALESLVELADESGHMFSGAFWSDLADCAKGMGMSSQARYCDKMILQPPSRPGPPLPKGWTEEKLNDNRFKVYIAQRLKDEWAAERRKKDKLDSFISENGFHITSPNRDGMIYYIENGKVIEFAWEMSGVKQYDILISFDSVNNWALPTTQELSKEDKMRIKFDLIEWLELKKIRADLY